MLLATKRIKGRLHATDPMNSVASGGCLHGVCSLFGLPCHFAPAFVSTRARPEEIPARQADHEDPSLELDHHRRVAMAGKPTGPRVPKTAGVLSSA